MLYRAIRKACEKYHDCDYGPGYDDALGERCKWIQNDRPAEPEVETLVDFVNSWSTRMKKDIPAIRSALNEILPELNTLHCKTILDVDLCDQSTSELICRSFKRLANFGHGNKATGASKMLHIIYPKLFLMWDASIVRGYGGHFKPLLYTDFLRRMQRLANYAISQIEKECDVCRDEAIARLKCDGHTLAKALDEYNYVKFTMNDDAVWKAEYESCSSP